MQTESSEDALAGTDTLYLQHLAARNGKRRHLAETSQITLAERTGSYTIVVSPLYARGLGEFDFATDTESVTLENMLENALENEQLTNLILAWPSLPLNVRQAILLLAGQ